MLVRKCQSDAAGVRQGQIPVVQLLRFDVAILQNCVTNSQAFPGTLEADIEPLVDEIKGAENFLGNVAEKFFREIHQIFIGCICLIEFHHREFRVVAYRDAFVAEVAVDLENPVQTANNKAFQVQLRGNAEVQFHIQSVVMGYERPGRCPSGNLMHHGCFNFQKIAIGHEAADQVDDAGALEEYFTCFRIYDQVNIALAVAGFHIGQAMKFFRQRQKRFDQQPYGADMEGKFTGFGPERETFGADDIADVERIENCKRFFADLIFFDVQLDAPFSILQLDKSRLAERSACQNAPGNAYLGVRCVECLN